MSRFFQVAISLPAAAILGCGLATAQLQQQPPQDMRELAIHAVIAHRMYPRRDSLPLRSCAIFNALSSDTLQHPQLLARLGLPGALSRAACARRDSSVIRFIPTYCGVSTRDMPSWAEIDSVAFRSLRRDAWSAVVFLKNTVHQDVYRERYYMSGQLSPRGWFVDSIVIGPNTHGDYC